MALQVASSEAQREQMSALVEEVRARPAPPAKAQPVAEVPEEPALRALRSDASITGELVQVDCLQSAARLVIRSAGSRTFLLVRDPGAVLMKGAGSRTLELQCGTNTPKRVEVAYQTRHDDTYGTAGDVTAVEFK